MMPMSSLRGNGKHGFLETLIVRIHHVERHLHRIEGKAVVRRHVDHVQVICRRFMSRKSDKANLAGLLCCNQRFDRAARGEDAVGVIRADILVNLHEIAPIGQKSRERLVELRRRRRFCASVQLRHQKDFVAIASDVERLTHTQFARAAVIVPRVVHKRNAAIDAGVNERDCFGSRQVRMTDMEAAHPHQADKRFRPAEPSLRNRRASRGAEGRRGRHRNRDGARARQKGRTIHFHLTSSVELMASTRRHDLSSRACGNAMGEGKYVMRMVSVQVE